MSADNQGPIDDDLSGDDTRIDLSPRESVAGSTLRGRTGGSRRWAWVAVLAVIAVAGFILLQGISNASLFFRNADEAIEQRAELGERRFRLQGTAVSDTIAPGDGFVGFDVEYNDVRVPVRHVGDPPDLFQGGIPVVLEGRWNESGEWFDSSVMIVRHTNEYEADYGDRLDQADTGG